MADTLGFAVNPQFTDDRGACTIVSDEVFGVLLTEPFSRAFTRRKPCDMAAS